VAQRQRDNPYLSGVPQATEQPIELLNTGLTTVRFKDNLKAIAGLEELMTTTAALQTIAGRSQVETQQFELISAGVAA
jgi:hypothetical protein